MITVEAVANGYIVTSPQHDSEGLIGSEKTVVEVDEDIDEIEAETKATQKLLYVILEYFGLIGSKHDSKRVRVIIEEKDKDY